MTTLYTIAEQFKELAALAETADEDLAVALRDTMEGIEGEFQEKGKAIAMITLNIDGDLEAIQSQIDRLTERKRIINNRKEGLKEYLRTNMDVDGETMVEPDGNLFKAIVNGVAERQNDLTAIVNANRPLKERQVYADEPLLMAVLLCGSYELLSHQDIDTPIIISGYVDVAKAFFSGHEPGLINGILDSVRKVTRG